MGKLSEIIRLLTAVKGVMKSTLPVTQSTDLKLVDDPT